MSTQLVDFDAAIIESVDEAVRVLFSEQVVNALHSNLERRTVSWGQIPNQLPTLTVVLQKYFGLGAHTVERTIARRLYSRLNLEFRPDNNYELTDYVTQARQKLQPTSTTSETISTSTSAPTSEPTSGALPLEDDFDRLLVEAVRETIEDVLGSEPAKSALRILTRDFKFEDLPRRMPTFYAALGRMFGKDRGRVETAIARKLYGKLCLEFAESLNTELSGYIERALLELRRRETTSFRL